MMEGKVRMEIRKIHKKVRGRPILNLPKFSSNADCEAVQRISRQLEFSVL